MRRSFIIAWALLLAGFACLGQASAYWQSRDSNYNISANVATYQGPGDLGISGAVAWWGLRCYSYAYSGNVADITDASTGNTTGTRLQCAGGVVSALVSASACTFVTGNACSSLATTCAVSCNIEEMYDQSGGTNCTATACNVLQATNADRPTVVLNCLGSFYCLQGNNSAGLVSANAITTLAQPFSFSVVGYFTTTGSTNGLLGSASTNLGVQAASSASTIQVFSGSGVTGSFSLSAWHNVQAVVQSTQSLNIDNTITTGSGGANTLTGKIIEFAGITGRSLGTVGQEFEGGVWSGAFTTGQQTSLCHNQYTYWGTSTSC